MNARVRQRSVAAALVLALTGCTSPTDGSTGIHDSCGIVYGTTHAVVEVTTQTTVRLDPGAPSLLIFTRDCSTAVRLLASDGLSDVHAASGKPTTGYFVTPAEGGGSLTVSVGGVRTRLVVEVRSNTTHPA